MCGCKNIPVFKGDKIVLEKDSDKFFGEDGIGGMYETYAKTHELSVLEEEQKKTAFTFLEEQSKLHPNEITIVCLAPLTNIGHLIKDDPGFASRIKNIVILGSAYLGKGNAFNCTAEFNFNLDPEAAKLTVNSFQNTTIVPMEILYQYYLIEEQKLVQTFCHDSYKGKFINDIFAHTRATSDIYPVGDPIAICVAFFPEFVKSYIEKQV